MLRVGQKFESGSALLTENYQFAQHALCECLGLAQGCCLKLQAGAKGANAAALATKLRQHYTDSVDILTLTPDLEVLGHLHNMSLFHPYYLPRK